MGILDGPMRNIASTLIGVLSDTTSTITRTTEANYNPETGEADPPVTTTYSVKTSPPEAFKTLEIDGTNVLKGDFKVIVAARDLTIEPSPQTDTLTRASVVYKIIAVEPIVSGDQVAAYQLQCRR